MIPFLTDALWARLEPLLPPPPPRRFRFPGRKHLDYRKVLTGILFVLKTGIAWDDLPASLRLLWSLPRHPGLPHRPVTAVAAKSLVRLRHLRIETFSTRGSRSGFSERLSDPNSESPCPSTHHLRM